jgi:micrococcal nuclease
MYQYRIKKVNRILDGDTFEAELDLGFNITLTQMIRLVDIDSPEIHTLNEEHKKYGIRAKEKLIEYLSFKDGDIIVATLKPNSSDKYGRILGTVYKEGQNLTASEYMIANNYAWYYDGKTKIKDYSILSKL